MNIGSAEKPWSVYLESAPEDDCTPLFTELISGLPIIHGDDLEGVSQCLLGCSGRSCASEIFQTD